MVLILTTVGTDEQARSIAHALVEARLAACINLLPVRRSLYRWKGTIEEEPETLLLVKTRADRIESVKNWILEHHPYDLPEFLVIPVADGSEQYLAWVHECTRPVSPKG